MSGSADFPSIDRSRGYTDMVAAFFPIFWILGEAYAFVHFYAAAEAYGLSKVQFGVFGIIAFAFMGGLIVGSYLLIVGIFTDASALISRTLFLNSLLLPAGTAFATKRLCDSMRPAGLIIE